MDTRKLMVKISYGLIAVIVVVVIGFLVYQQRLIRQLSQNQAQTPPAAAVMEPNTPAENNTPAILMAESGRDQSKTEVDTLRYQLEASEEELDMAREELAKKQNPLEDMSEFAAREKKMRENPSVMKVQRRMAENMLTENYGALFEKLGLSDEKLQDLKALMVDNQMQMEETSLDMMSQSMSEEERMEKMQQLGEEQNAEFEQKVKDLLSADDYEKYDAYERRLSERFLVKQFVNPLSANDGLSDETEQALIDAMYEARKEVEAEYGTDSDDSPRIFIGVSTKDQEEGLDRQFAIYDRYVESARAVLSESQAEEFEAVINGTKDMMNMLIEDMPSSSAEAAGDES